MSIDNEGLIKAFNDLRRLVHDKEMLAKAERELIDRVKDLLRPFEGRVLDDSLEFFFIEIARALGPTLMRKSFYDEKIKRYDEELDPRVKF